jgi:hypothetical protein
MTQGGTGNLHEVVTYGPEGITLPNKLRIMYPELRQTTSGFEYIADARQLKKYKTGEGAVWTRIYGGKVTENLIQALAALVIREQMASIGQHYHVAFQVHDEIIVTAPEAEAQQAEAVLVHIMSTPPLWAPTLPVACESGTACNYGDT